MTAEMDSSSINENEGDAAAGASGSNYEMTSWNDSLEKLPVAIICRQFCLRTTDLDAPPRMVEWGAWTTALGKRLN